MGACCTLRTNTPISPVTIKDLKDLDHMDRPSAFSLSKLRVSTQTNLMDDNSELIKLKMNRYTSQGPQRTSIEQINAYQRSHKLSIESLLLGERGLLLDRGDSTQVEQYDKKRGSGTNRNSLHSQNSFALGRGSLEYASNVALGSRTSLLLCDPTPNNTILRFSRFGTQSPVYKEAAEECSEDSLSSEEDEEEKNGKDTLNLTPAERNSRKSHTTSNIDLKPVLIRQSRIATESAFTGNFDKISRPKGKRVRFSEFEYFQAE